ncbi:MAG: hypothetical protein [Microviridae sp.]|nr:MAG: hypothetical protein [Microviridae sp.]
MNAPTGLGYPRDTFNDAIWAPTTFPVTGAGVSTPFLCLPDAALTGTEERTILGNFLSTLSLAANTRSGFGIAIGGNRLGLEDDVAVYLRYQLDYSFEVPYTSGGTAGEFLKFRPVIIRRNVSLSGANVFVDSTNAMVPPNSRSQWDASLSNSLVTDFYRVSGSASGVLAVFGTGIYAGENLSCGLTFSNSNTFTGYVRALYMSVGLKFWTSDQLALNPNV